MSDTYPISLQTICLIAEALTAATASTGHRHQCGFARAALDEELPGHLFAASAELPRALPVELRLPEPAANVVAERLLPPLSYVMRTVPGDTVAEAVDVWELPRQGETIMLAGGALYRVDRVTRHHGAPTALVVVGLLDDGGSF